MDKVMLRHKRIWHTLLPVVSVWLRHKFNFKPEIAEVEGPCLIVPNHVTTWDPLLVALSFPKHQFYFVASEHIFRWGILTKIIDWLVSPIARRKGTTGTDTVMTCLRRIRKGASIGLFAEGECSWDGRSIEIFPATGKLAKASGATLVTYKIEGGYLSLPRWSNKLRRGKMRGHVVGVYPPEQIKAMTAEEVNALINRDIYEDAWERQEAEQTVFASKAPAAQIERLLYTCPACGQIGGIRGEGHTVRCKCGFSVRMKRTGFFESDKPFRHAGEWDRWQKQQLPAHKGDENGLLFSDTDVTLTEVFTDHETKEIGTGEIRQYADRIFVCGEEIPMSEISGMSIHGAQAIIFAAGERYFELRSKQLRCMRKYLDYYKHVCSSAVPV